MLIIVKMPPIVGVLTFMSRINFMLSRVEYEKSSITSGPGFKKMYCSYVKGVQSSENSNYETSLRGFS